MPETPYPNYTIHRQVLLDLAFAVLLGEPRSFRAHALQMMRSIQPPLRLLDQKNMPAHGPGVITVNHYARPGFWAPWFSAAISASVPVEVYWTMTGALTFPARRFAGFRRWLSEQVLGRMARTYGFNTMPPMPPVPQEVTARSASVQRLVAHIRAYPETLIGLAPEGGDQPGGILTLAPEGFGKLALLLARRGMPFYPAGVYEADGCLTLCFGPPYHLAVGETADRREADRLARHQVMQAIAACLPERLRGEF